MADATKGWTVVGYWQDESQPWVEYSEAETPQKALTEIADFMIESNSFTPEVLRDLIIVAVFPGRHEEALLSLVTVSMDNMCSKKSPEAGS